MKKVKRKSEIEREESVKQDVELSKQFSQGKIKDAQDYLDRVKESAENAEKQADEILAGNLAPTYIVEPVKEHRVVDTPHGPAEAEEGQVVLVSQDDDLAIIVSEEQLDQEFEEV